MNLPTFRGTPVAAVIVDLDGTMIDTLGDFEAALNLMLGELGLPRVPRAFVERSIGKGSEHLIMQTLREVDAGGSQSSRVLDDVFDTAFASYQRHYAHINGNHSAVFPGVVEGLDDLSRRGLAMACLTNKPTAFAIELLEAKGLAGHFKVVFGGDAFARKKPDPLPLLETCKALGTAPTQTLMIGDSSNDALASHAAGCPVVLVTYGYNHGEPIREVKADAFVDGLDQVCAELLVFRAA